MNLPGREFLEAKMIYIGRSGDDRSIVGRSGGRNWGRPGLDPDGTVVAGRISSSMDLFDAIGEAESLFGRTP